MPSCAAEIGPLVTHLLYGAQVSDIQFGGDRSYCLGMDVDPLSSSSPAAATAIVLQPCDGTARQKWEYDPGTSQIKYAYDPSFCVNLAGNNQVNGAPLEMASCAVQDSMQWDLGSDLVDDTIMLLVDPTFCLTLTNNAIADGTAITIDACVASAAQAWLKSDHLARHWQPDPNVTHPGRRYTPTTPLL